MGVSEVGHARQLRHNFQFLPINNPAIPACLLQLLTPSFRKPQINGKVKGKVAPELN
jgi:hypothetical protein